MKAYTVDKVNSKICAKCPRRDDGDVVQSKAGEEGGVMIVGECPSTEDVDCNSQMSGPSGAVLGEVMRKTKLEIEPLTLTNSIRCNMENRAPAKDKIAIQQCRKHLIREIELVKPSFVMSLGETALKSVIGKTGIMRERGMLVKQKLLKTHPFNAFPTVSPGFLLRKRSAKPLFDQDFARAKKFIDNPDWKPSPVTYTVCTTMEMVDHFFERVHVPHPVITFDTETSGYNFQTEKLEASALDYRNAHLLCLSFSWKRRTGWVIPLLGFKAEPIWTFKQLYNIFSRLKVMFEHAGILWVGHNIKFDQRFISRLGTNASRFHDFIGDKTAERAAKLQSCDVDVLQMETVQDTFQIECLLNEEGAKGLKELASIHSDMGMYEEEIMEAQKVNHEKV